MVYLARLHIAVSDQEPLFCEWFANETGLRYPIQNMHIIIETVSGRLGPPVQFRPSCRPRRV